MVKKEKKASVFSKFRDFTEIKEIE